MPLISWSINLVNVINLDAFYVKVLCMLVHSHTLYSSCLGNIFAFECVKLANAWRGERQTASEQAHPSCLSVSCGWGRPAAMLPAISVSLIHIFTSSLLRHFFKKNKKTICWCFTETAINLAEQQIRVLSSNIWKPCCLHRIILSFKQHGGPSHTTSVWGAVVSNPDRSSATWKSWSSFVEANYDPPPLPSLFYSRRLGEFSDVLRVLSGWKKEASSVIFYSPLL